MNMQGSVKDPPMIFERPYSALEHNTIDLNKTYQSNLNQTFYNSLKEPVLA